MKKLLAILLTLSMLLGMCVIAHAEERPTITWYMRGANNEYMAARTRELVGLKKIMDIANVDIDFTIANGSNDEIDAQYVAMLASGNYPDAIHWLHEEAYAGGWTQLYTDGIAIELNDVIDRYMPNYKAFLEANPEIASSLMNDAGQYLYFPCINPMETIEDIMAVTYYGLLIRADWLENVAKEVPTSIDEWYDVLTAFKEGDPNGNGEQDEIPFDAGSAGHSLFMSAFGIQSGAYIDPETGKVGYGEYSEKYKEYLETMAKWYAEGLIQNLYIDDAGTLAQSADPNIYADIAGSWKGLSNYWEQRLPQVLEKNPNADFVAIQWPQYVHGDGVFYAGDYGMGYGDRVTTVITVDCKNVEAAARLIDTMYTEEGTNLTTWGTEDSDPFNATQEWTGGHGTYYIAEDGTFQETDWANEICTNFYDGAFPNKYRYAMSHASWPRWGAAEYIMATREDTYVNSSKLWALADNGLEYPAAIVLSTDAQKAVAEIENMGSYIAEMTCKFITGAEPLTNFDTYMDTLQKMGIENLIALYQEAYDSFMARGN